MTSREQAEAMNQYTPPEVREQVFWSRVKIGPPNSCWEWQGSLTHRGYGRFGNRRPSFAHRIAYQYAIGTIKPGLCICHHCDNPKCVNPSHLFMGTFGDNNRDRNRKGRYVPYYGEAVSSAKLTEEKVRQIRQLYPSLSLSAIAQKFKVGRTAIHEVVTRETWRHVPAIRATGGQP